ncbi:hypothetical protein B0H11DRAFT_1938195 [Mycena galericulata]|nr:hypothetical protein B0H11DRAFT_1938195 [Mycena galericulata]
MYKFIGFRTTRGPPESTVIPKDTLAPAHKCNRKKHDRTLGLVEKLCATGKTADADADAELYGVEKVVSYGVEKSGEASLYHSRSGERTRTGIASEAARLSVASSSVDELGHLRGEVGRGLAAQRVHAHRLREQDKSGFIIRVTLAFLENEKRVFTPSAPEVTIDCGASMTSCGFIRAPAELGVYTNGKRAFYDAMSANHTSRGCAARAPMFCTTSPRTGIVASTTLFTFFGRISKWMIPRRPARPQPEHRVQMRRFCPSRGQRLPSTMITSASYIVRKTPTNARAELGIVIVMVAPPPPRAVEEADDGSTDEAASQRRAYGPAVKGEKRAKGERVEQKGKDAYMRNGNENEGGREQGRGCKGERTRAKDERVEQKRRIYASKGRERHMYARRKGRLRQKDGYMRKKEGVCVFFDAYPKKRNARRQKGRKEKEGPQNNAHLRQRRPSLLRAHKRQHAVPRVVRRWGPSPPPPPPLLRAPRRTRRHSKDAHADAPATETAWNERAARGAPTPASQRMSAHTCRAYSASIHDSSALQRRAAGADGGAVPFAVPAKESEGFARARAGVYTAPVAASASAFASAAGDSASAAAARPGAEEGEIEELEPTASLSARDNGKNANTHDWVPMNASNTSLDETEPKSLPDEVEDWREIKDFESADPADGPQISNQTSQKREYVTCF